ncbi:MULTISPECIES: FAD-dependent oxidoreductase [unclassified Sphingomonas]|uniref:FAD-dependent oxidoreductase n=1 Tax=Sphingomonas sp. PvP015 TaxID=3156388 RepID=UPI0033997CCA
MMLAVHAGFAAALLGTLGPPSSRPVLHISPGGAGNWSGDSWRNAGPLANLNTFISAASARGGEVWLRADAGTYTLPTSTQTLTRGGTVAAPVRICGVDVNGLPMKAKFVGTRANPPTFTGGDNTEQFWLNAGASNLRFEQMDFRNAGTVFRLRQSNTNLAFEDITANNIRRLIQNNGTAANIVGFGIRRCNVLGYSKQAVIIRYDSAQGEIEDCEFDAGANQDGDLWSTGIQLDDTAHDITLRRVKANNNIQNNGTSYWNGDGFSCERGNYRIVYVECSAKGNSDGAFDLKGQVTLIRCLADGNKRGFRMWGDALLIDCIACNPVRMGSGSVGLVYAYQNSRVRVQGGSYTITSALPTSPFHIFEAGFMAVDQTALNGVVKPSSVKMFDTEGNPDALYTTWDHADVVMPTIESITYKVPGVAAPYVVTPSAAGTAIEIAENQAQAFALALGEPGNVSVTGPDAGKFAVTGRTINMRAQDYDVAGGPGTDGSKTLRISITVRDANGLLITARNGTGFAQFRSFSGSNAAAIGAVGYWAGVNWCSFHRSASTGYRAARMGVPIATQASASVALASATPTIRILGAAGASTASVRTIAGAYVTNAALTDAQVSECEAAMQDYIDGVDYGEPYIEEKGIGPASVSADVVIFGTGIFAICAAVKAVRLGRTVKLMGDWMDETAWNLGGMPAAGLNLIDAKTFSRVSGIFRQIIRWGNIEFYGRGTTTNETASFSTENGLSIEARGWNMGARRILDPSRQTGVLTGYDIPVYMSGGIASVQKTGTTITSVTGNDGRVFNCSQFIDASYEGDSIPLTGAPFTQGMEAAVAGTGEAGNGLQNILATLLLLKNDITGTTFKVDPYITAGNAASGLLPDVELNPAGTRGQADPALQSMNFRLPVQSSLLRQAPLDAVPPRNYNPLRYEGLGRLAAAATAAGETLSEGSLYGNAPVGPGTLQDMNSGPGGFSTDCPGSGTRYMNAGANLAARRAVVDDNRDYQRGLYYWLRYSGDSRIPAARVTNMAALGLDALHFLDPCTGGSLWFPDRVYPREPIWQLRSDFVYNADDVRKAGGTAVRGSGKIATCVSYRDDKHDVRRVAFDDGAGISIYRQGVVEGAVRSASVPLDVALPPTSVATNYQIIGAPSFTKMAWSAARMEFTLGLLGETAGTNAHVAIRDAVSVQATTYSNGSTGVRELMLTTTDAVVPVLPLNN